MESEELSHLYLSGLSRKLMCEKLHISLGSLKYLLYKNKIRKIKNHSDYPPLTQKQLEIIIGSLLGDGGINSIGLTHNCRFVKSQGKNIKKRPDRKEYVEWHFNQLLPFSSKLSEGKSRLKFKQYKNKLQYSHSWRLATCNHPIFTELSNQWYLNDDGNFIKKDNHAIKVIPKDLKLTPLILAIWYCDDGSHEPKFKKARISSNCFTFEEHKFLIERLKLDLNLECSIIKSNKNRYNIYIPTKTYEKFIDIIKPYVIWDCFKYKVSNYI